MERSRKTANKKRINKKKKEGEVKDEVHMRIRRRSKFHERGI